MTEQTELQIKETKVVQLYPVSLPKRNGQGKLARYDVAPL